MLGRLADRLRNASPALAAAAAALVLPLYALKVARRSDYTDFLVYHRTAARLLDADWVKLYNLELDGNSPYRYAPPTLPALLPFGFFSEPTARMIWFFLQFGCFLAGFLLLLRTLRETGVPLARARIAVGVAFLYSLRFLIDSFSIGQVTGLMFLGLVLGLRAWLAGRPARAGAWLSPGALLKVGPGLLYGPPWFGGSPPARGSRLRLLGGALAVPTALTLMLQLWIWARGGSVATTLSLFSDWWHLLLADSSFFDASHYGSQSVKSALLRMEKQGLLVQGLASWIHRGAVLAGVGALVLLWRRKPEDARARLLFFAAGVMGYLLLMPFTFKYSLPLLGISLAAWLARPLDRTATRVFLACAPLLPLAGLDLVGERLFFAIQHASLPALALLALSAAIYRDAWRATRP